MSAAHSGHLERSCWRGEVLRPPRGRRPLNVAAQVPWLVLGAMSPPGAPLYDRTSTGVHRARARVGSSARFAQRREAAEGPKRGPAGLDQFSELAKLVALDCARLIVTALVAPGTWGRHWWPPRAV